MLLVAALLLPFKLTTQTLFASFAMDDAIFLITMWFNTNPGKFTMKRDSRFGYCDDPVAADLDIVVNLLMVNSKWTWRCQSCLKMDLQESTKWNLDRTTPKLLLCFIFKCLNVHISFFHKTRKYFALMNLTSWADVLKSQAEET